MFICSDTAFAEAIASYAFDVEVRAIEREAVADAVRRDGLIVVGETHGVRQNAAALYRLAVDSDARAIAFEWSFDELDQLVQLFLRDGLTVLDRFWSLPPTAEFFAGDGRVTAGHFALMLRLAQEQRIEQLILIDQLSEGPPGDPGWRDRGMAERLVSEWDPSLKLIVLTGAAHAGMADKEETIATTLAGRHPRLQTAMLEYVGGTCFSQGEVRRASGRMPEAAIEVHLDHATPADVPGHPGLGADQAASRAPGAPG